MYHTLLISALALLGICLLLMYEIFVVVRSMSAKRGREEEADSAKKRAAHVAKAVVPAATARPGLSYAAMNFRSGGLAGVEKKFLDVSTTVIALTAPVSAAGGRIAASIGCTNCYSAPARGSGPTERIGNQITCKYMVVKGQIQVAAVTDLIVNLSPVFEGLAAYVAVILDRQTNVVALNSEDVFVNPSGNGTMAPFPLRNLSNSHRFKILKEQTFNISQKDLAMTSTNLYSSGQTIPFDFYIPLKDLQCNFISNNATANVNAVADNSINIVAYASRASSCNIIVNTRLRYHG